MRETTSNSFFPDAADNDGLEPVVARLKWFNATKGFGFLVPVDDPVDAFVHITVLQSAGLTALGEGAIVKCVLKGSPKGYQVTKIVEVIDPGNLDPLTNVDNSVQLQTMTGIVKWYKPDKGFGFIIPDDGMKDVFVHKTCLDRNGISGLVPGQKVEMVVQSVEKGREAFKVTLIASFGGSRPAPR